MARKTQRNDEAPFQKLSDACRITGLSEGSLRKMCREGTCPHIKMGKKYFVNIPELYRLLGVTE